MYVPRPSGPENSVGNSPRAGNPPRARNPPKAGNSAGARKLLKAGNPPRAENPAGARHSLRKRHPAKDGNPVAEGHLARNGNPAEDENSAKNENPAEDGNPAGDRNPAKDGNPAGETNLPGSRPQDRLLAILLARERELRNPIARSEIPIATMLLELERIAQEEERIEEQRPAEERYQDNSSESSITALRGSPDVTVHDGKPEPLKPEEMMVNLECQICFEQRCSVIAFPCGKF